MTQSTRFSLVVLVALVGLLATGCASAPQSVPTPTPAATAGASTGATAPADDLALTDPAIGPTTAPVIIQEYGDYSCPACAVWEAHGVRKQLLDKYGDKLRFVWHDYAVLSPQSRPSSLAARCAGDQGKYWQYHDVLYAHYPALENSDLKGYAADMGLDTASFNQCLDAQTHFDRLGLGLADGMNYGIFATPAFRVNGKLIQGGQSFEYFSSVIDSMLAGSQS